MFQHKQVHELAELEAIVEAGNEDYVVMTRDVSRFGRLLRYNLQIVEDLLEPAGIPLDRDDLTLINAADGFLDPRWGIYEGCTDGSADRPGGRIQSGGNVCAGDAAASIVPGARTIDYDVTPVRELKETSYYVLINQSMYL